jgi:hypothetical protein
VRHNGCSFSREGVSSSGFAIGPWVLYMRRTIAKFIKRLSLLSECVPEWCPENLQPLSAKGKMDCTLDLLPHKDFKEECGSSIRLGDGDAQATNSALKDK